MACTFELALACDDDAYAEQAARAAFTEIDRIERELSRFVPTSDVARINALRAGETIRVGIEAAECLMLAAQVCADTNGAFDVTYRGKPVAPTPHTTSPSEPEAQARSTTPLEFDPESHCVHAQVDGVHVDLGGIGKGYAIDCAVEILHDWSIDAGLIHSGQSCVSALGSPPGGERWSVALRDPLDHDQTIGRAALKDAALSGSGRALHGDHIINPRTGRPCGDKLGTWALAPSAAVSDALATAFMVMSPQEIETYCRTHSAVSALIVLNVAGKREKLSFGPGLAH
jgi:thiamine biosynthesis lipoprotein